MLDALEQKFRKVVQAHQAAQDKRRSDAIPAMMDALLRQRAQAIKEGRRAEAIDRISAQKAWDEGIRADELADEKHQAGIADASRSA
jgi:hypothetical protein